MKPEKTSGFRVLNVGFRVLVGFQFSGSGRVRVAKKSGYLPGFRVFGFKYPSLVHIQSPKYSIIHFEMNLVVWKKKEMPCNRIFPRKNTFYV